MRRFVKSYTVKRHVQITVIQDGDQRHYEIVKWAAEDAAPELIAAFPYQAQDPDSMDRAFLQAVQAAARLADAERAGTLEIGARG